MGHDPSSRPVRLLARHFFGAFFDFGLFSDEGSQSFERALLGAVAVAIGIGLLLVRVFLAKYVVLATGPADQYWWAIAADHAFLVALPMWIVSAAVVLAGHGLFPDETDFRVLMAEPVSRGTIFAAKLAALLVFVALFVVGSHVALAPLTLLTMIGPAGSGSGVARAAAFAVATAAASGCAALMTIAIHGSVVLLVPRARQMTVAAAVRSLLVWLLVLSLLFIARLPATARDFELGAWWLRLAPPVWFVGLERWLLGDASMAPLALRALEAIAAAAVLAVGTYAIVYRRFERAMIRPLESHAPRASSRVVPNRAANAPYSVRRAVAGFASATLRRSMLHQGVVVALGSAAAGLVVNGLLVARFPELTSRWMLCWSPFALIIVASPAVRLSLSLPLELRANWIFRMTEAAETRAEVIAAGVQTVMWLGVVVPVALMLPPQWMVMGPRTLTLAVVELSAGWLVVEVLMRDWRRIPFTCSYVPGKGFVPHMFVKGVVVFFAFAGVGARLLQLCSAAPVALPFVLAVVCGPALWLRTRRRRQTLPLGLAYEDEMPNEIIGLRLN